MVQIDGLGYREFVNALESGELPFLKKLINEQHYNLHGIYSGLPSSTPAVQGELFYGVKTCVPAFAYVRQRTGEMYRMYDRDSASTIEKQLKRSGRALLSGGSSYSNIYTGGADESHFCAASFGFGHSLKSFKIIGRIAIGIIFLPTLIRTFSLLILEFLLALLDCVRGIMSGNRILPEFKFIFARVALCIGLRDAVRIGAQVDILRGLPIVHLNLLGYDEQAHRRGPDSAFAHWTLKGIDSAVKSLWQACHESPLRHYDLWVYSDHGQEATQPYLKLARVELEQSIANALGTIDTSLDATSMISMGRSYSDKRASLLGGKYLQKILPSRSESESNYKFFDFRVAAMGPVGHIYAPALKDAAHRQSVANFLASVGYVPSVMYIDHNNEVVIKTKHCLFHLPQHSKIFAGESHAFADAVGEDLIALCRHPDAGQLVLLGWDGSSHPVSFPYENGAHAGPGSRETHAFALLPADAKIEKTSSHALRFLDLRNAAFEILDQDPTKPTSNMGTRPRIVSTNEFGSKVDEGGLGSLKTFRLMTYNVHGCVGMDGRHAPERIARVIAHFQPDVVALQELDVHRSRSFKINQVDSIARLLEMEYKFHPSMHIESGAYGNAILSHLPMQLVKAEQLVVANRNPRREPRGAIWATIEVGSQNLQVICTHLGLFPDERLRQMQILQSDHWLANDKFYSDPAILCGDFNAAPGSAALRALNKRWIDVQQDKELRLTTEFKTFSSILPALRIDHVFSNANLKPTSVQVPRFELARRASDHLPLVVDFTFERAESARNVEPGSQLNTNANSKY